MLRETECNIKRYEVEYFEGFILEVEEKGEMVKYWLGYKNYGIKSFMFGLFKKDVPSLKDILDIAMANLPHYIESYNEDYVEGDEYFETEKKLRAWRKAIDKIEGENTAETVCSCPYCVHEAASRD